MGVAALPKPPRTGTKVSQRQPAGWRIAQEPFEVIKKAGEQIVGTPPPPDEAKSPPNPHVIQESALEKKRDSFLQALRTELQEIDELAKKSQEETRARWEQQERMKEQREEEARKAKGKPLLEPVTRVKRGILGGMQRIGLKRKQRQVELVKTPSN